MESPSEDPYRIESLGESLEDPLESHLEDLLENLLQSPLRYFFGGLRKVSEGPPVLSSISVLPLLAAPPGSPGLSLLLVNIKERSGGERIQESYVESSFNNSLQKSLQQFLREVLQSLP